MELLTRATYSNEINEREANHRQLAYEAACESIVVLKNEGVLPFAEKKIAAYGSGVNYTIKGGTGSGEVNERHSVSIYEGLRNRGFEIVNDAWLLDYQELYLKAEEDYKKKKKSMLIHPTKIMELMKDDFQAPVKEITAEDVLEKGTDACIYVVSRQAGEGVDRRLMEGDYYLTDDEIRNIAFCAEHYSNFVLIINCGSGIDLSRIEHISGIRAIVYICQLGMEGGHAVADVLSGAVTPSGRLTDTWAMKYEDIPFSGEYSYLNGNLTEEDYKEDIYVGYRYFDSFGVEPRYPFGYGLSYTNFSIKPGQLRVERSQVLLDVEVCNAGDTYSGCEVVQLYVSAPQGKLEREYQSLVAFEKTPCLKPGESTVVTLCFDMKDVAGYYTKEARYLLEAGKYILRVGNHSRNTEVAGIVQLEETIVVSEHDNVCPEIHEFDSLHQKAPIVDDPEHVPTVVLDAKSIVTKVYDYNTELTCDDEWARQFVDSLTEKEMVDIVVGSGMFSTKNRFILPGAVGNTTSKFWDRGLANATLCDGPAGLRIQKVSTVEKNNQVKSVELPMAFFEALPGVVKKMMKGNPEKYPCIYQYATAFPVSAAMAQSWNKDLFYRVGEAVHEEMKEYGCTYWLAPAINIHRNPLCGRNFEYYSEDPRLTGLLAAKLTKGVQKEDGFYVTVKHFACNNQEDNRNYVSSNLTERALREIYLKAFEICVREGKTKGIMTSYNRLNGVYTPNSYDLCTKLLRYEWGFDGVVMTDWFSTGGKKACDAMAMKAGNDLIMPGGNGNKKKILSALKAGNISKQDIHKCCCNVVKSIHNSSIQKEYIR